MTVELFLLLFFASMVLMFVFLIYIEIKRLELQDKQWKDDNKLSRKKLDLLLQERF